jgi:hypothetical protein
MQDLKLLRALLITSEYKNDEAVKCICDAVSEDKYTAVGSCSRLCEVLLVSGKTLSEYMFGLA